MEVFDDYKLIIVPQEPVLTILMEERTRLIQKYSIENPGTTSPQLILAKFQQIATTESKLINRLHIIGDAMPPVIIQLYNFGAYPFHTIFVAIQNHMPLNSLVKTLRKNVAALINKRYSRKATFMSSPHLTIARKLSIEKFKKAWSEFSVRELNAKFIADHMLLVKREAATGKYISLAVLKFGNNPAEGEQIKLFN